MKALLTIIALIFSAQAIADWQLKPESSNLSFISFKKTHIAEVHNFTRISGQIDADENVEITIDLSSVNTGIEIRDQRMQSLLFDTELFPQAAVKIALGGQVISKIKVGQSAPVEVDALLSLHGEQKRIAGSVLVSKLNEENLVVSLLTPVIINTADFSLTAGVKRLVEIAQLPSISEQVPVSFVFSFTNTNSK